MNLTKDQISRIISIVVMAAIALLAVFGYDVIIVQPQLNAMRGGQPQTAGSQAVLGPYYENLNVGKDFRSFGSATINAATVTTLTATTIVSQAVAFSGTGDGTAANPAYTFASDPHGGMYHVAANDIGIGVASAKVLDVNAAGLGVTGIVTPSGGVVGNVTGNVTGTLTGNVVGAEITASGGLTVTGATVLNGGLAMDTNAFTVADTTGNTVVSGTLKVTDTTTLVGAAALNGGLTMDTSAFSVADTTGNTVVSGTLNVTSTLSQGGVSFTGPIKYGTAATYTSGANIVHGFSVTPTMCMLWPAEVTATVTMTATTFSSNTATHSTPVMWQCGK